MAVSFVGASTAAAFTATNGASFTPALPSGWAPDDILVIVAHRSDNTAMTSLTGWTQVSALSGNNTAGQRVEVWWRRALATDTAPSITFGSGTVVRGARMYAIRGCPTAGDPFAGSSRSSNAASATITFATVTPSEANTLLLAVYAYEDDPSAASQITDWSTFDVQTSALGNDMALGHATRSWTPDDTATGGLTSTASGGTFDNSPNVGLLISFKPAVPARVGAGSLPPYTANLTRMFISKDISGLADTDPVSSWPDSSGNQAPAAQGTSTKRPLYRTNILNGHPVVRFDGTDDALLIPDPLLLGRNGITVYVAFTVADGIAEKYLLHRPSQIDMRVVTTSDQLRFGLQTGSYTILSTSTALSYGVLQRATFHYDGANYQIRREGTQEATGAKTGTMAAGSGDLAIGHASGGLAADVLAVLVYTEAHDSTEIADIEAWLKAEFGITGSGGTTLPVSTVSGTGTADSGEGAISGSGATLLPVSTLSGTGTSAVTGSGAALLPVSALQGTGTSAITGSGASELPAPTLSGTGTSAVTGSGAALLPVSTLTGSGTVTVQTGSGAVVLPVSTLTGSGTSAVTGSGASAIPVATLAGSGTTSVPITGTGSVELPTSSLSGVGTSAVTGSGASALPVSSLTGSGTFTVQTGQGSVVLPVSTLLGAGAFTTTGSGAIALPVPSLLGDGTAILLEATGDLVMPVPQLEGIGFSVYIPAQTRRFRFFRQPTRIRFIQRVTRSRSAQ